MAEPPLDPVYLRLQRYLYIGVEFPKYYPGCWMSHKYFEVDKLQVITEIMQTNPNDTEALKVILMAYTKGYYTRFETIAFALSKLLLLGGPKLKSEIYKQVPEICKTSEELMLFTKFTRNLKTGNGQGWCKGLRKWYHKREPMELAKEITRARGRFGHCHRTLLMKSHVKVEPVDVARDAVVKYSVFGIKKARQLVNDHPEAREVLDYIQLVEDLRHCEDPVAASVIVSNNSLTLEHVPGHLLTSQYIWVAVLPQLSLQDLLNNLQRIHNMGFLKMDSKITAVILSIFSNKDFVKKSKVTPLEIFITLCNYQKKCRPLRFEKAKVAADKEAKRRTRQALNVNTGLWEWNNEKRHPKEFKIWGIEQPPNEIIISALNTMLEETWLLTPSTGARYLLTLDMRHHMFKGHHFCKKTGPPKKAKKIKPSTSAADTANADPKKSQKRLKAECFYNKNVTPGHAAIILSLQILKREKNAKLAVFVEDGIQVVNLEPNFKTIEETEFVLRNLNTGRVQLDAPISYAMKSNTKIDVFINMVDRTTRFMELDANARGGRGQGGRYGPPPKPEKELVDHCPQRALLAYRAKAELPDARLVMISLGSHRVQTTDGKQSGFLDIVGIDHHVPKVLDAFALGLFN